MTHTPEDRNRKLEPQDLWPGRICVWRHRPSGGYGFHLRLVVKIVRVFPTKARIEVMSKGGILTWPLVSLKNLVDGTTEERSNRWRASVE